MYTRNTKVINPNGLHARPAGIFVEAARKFQSDITICNVTTNNPKPANAKMILRVLTQGMCSGHEVQLCAEGPDEQEAVDSLIALIESGCGEK